MFTDPLTTIVHLLIYAVGSLPVVLLLYPSLRRVVGVPYDRRQFLLSSLLVYLNILTNRPLAMVLNGLNIFSSLLFFFLIIRFVFKKRKGAGFFAMMKVIVLLSVEEAMCMLVFNLMAWLGFDQNKLMILDMASIFDPEKIFYSTLLNVLGILPIWLAIVLWQNLRNHHRQDGTKRANPNWQYTWIILRLAALVITGLGMLAMPFALFGNQSLLAFLMQNRREYALLSVCCALLMMIALSYLIQDIRYISQQRRLNTMEQQQAISRSLLQNLRFFRHNIINMLYGLEGVIINGDAEQLCSYYQQVREKCALVNNENIAALERITDPSVSAVLLHAVDRARMLNLPLNLYVQENVPLDCSLSRSDLCQILGVLLDNAIESANAANERFVSLELRAVDQATELIVKNTYSGQVDPAQLGQGGSSSKEGHSGQGLLSCYDILRRKRNAFLNFWVTGQYVHAQLLLSR